MIFGSNGDKYFNIGSMTHVSGNGKDDNLYDAGGVTHGRKGFMYGIGGMSHLSNGKTITKIGNTWRCGGKSYYMIAGMLHSSDGKTWHGSNLSETDIRRIIFSDNM